MVATSETAESPARSTANWTVPGAVLVVLVLWASAFIAIRSAAHSFSPGPMALIRLVVGTILLGGVAVRRPQAPRSRRPGSAV